MDFKKLIVFLLEIEGRDKVTQSLFITSILNVYACLMSAKHPVFNPPGWHTNLHISVLVVRVIYRFSKSFVKLVFWDHTKVEFMLFIQFYVKKKKDKFANPNPEQLTSPWYLKESYTLRMKSQNGQRYSNLNSSTKSASSTRAHTTRNFRYRKVLKKKKKKESHILAWKHKTWFWTMLIAILDFGT